MPVAKIRNSFEILNESLGDSFQLYWIIPPQLWICLPDVTTYTTNEKLSNTSVLYSFDSFVVAQWTTWSDLQESDLGYKV